MTMYFSSHCCANNVNCGIQIYYTDFLRRLRNYGFEFDGSLLENEDSLPDTPQPSVKRFTGEEVREQKIARFRRQKELKQTMEELRRQQQLNNSDESTLRELHLTVIKYWIEKVLEELNSIEDELPLVEMMSKRQQEMRNSPEVANRPRPEAALNRVPLKPFIITRSEQQKAVFGLGYPSIPTMTVDEWYNQRFGGNAAPSQASQKPGCSEGHAGDSCEGEHEREEDEDEKRARLMRWDEYKDDHRRGWDSDTSDKEDEDQLPLNYDDNPDKEEGEPPEKKPAAALWGDSLVEQGLLQRGSRIALEKQKDLCVPRGVESYHVPSTFTRVEKEEFEAHVEREAPSNSADDPFGDAPVDLSGETAFCERLSDDSWLPHARHLHNGSNRRGELYAKYGLFQGELKDLLNSFEGEREFESPVTEVLAVQVIFAEDIVMASEEEVMVTDPAQLLSPSYSLETLMAVEFSADTSIEQLGDEMAKAMGERDPKTVKSIVQVCGVEKAIALFEETRSVESQGGMMIDNGRRRRTPGGVFISLFKLDPDIPGDVKKRLFDETKMEARKILRARKKGRSDFAQDVAKVAELMKKEKEKNSADEALKPLPQVEQVLQPSDSGATVNNDVFDDASDINMEP
ncbi:TAP42-like family protein [Ancylostoma ceylanicum]|uniref:TAP42-like family protein n=1 Tax=Ancylostoma ceylanicum TaxID=53326 RepID=A0A0D6LH38_9BILA|nr:TAP42-like family protein [Ancylostoma ceylanicum]